MITAQTQIAGKTCIGKWKTIDDDSGRAKSIIEITKSGNRYYGQVIELLDPKNLEDSGVDTFEEIMCDDCPEDRGQGEPVIGLQLIWDMELDDDKWAEGKIMDPDGGKIYDCTMWLDEDDPSGNTLKVRGWLAFLFRTQTWYRVED